MDFAAIGPGGIPNTAATFDGQGAMLEIPAHQRLQLGTKGFSVSVWVDADSEFDSTQSGFDAADYDLSVDQPLLIGFGPNDYFKGNLADVKLYGRALSDEEIQTHAKLR